ncbi:MAG: DUF4239 domain-containing protein [Alphaproteobacteria bacterium]
MDVPVSTWSPPQIALFTLLVVGMFDVLVYLLVRRLHGTGWGPAALGIVSPQLLATVSILFALLTGFLGNNVWGDHTQARRAVAEEARSLNQVLLMAKGLPEDMKVAVRLWVGDYVNAVVTEEWPAMGIGHSGDKPYAVLYQALEAVIACQPESTGEQLAQTMVIHALNDTLSARTQRINLSEERIGPVKWVVMLCLAGLVLLTLGILHHANPIALMISLAIGGGGIAASLVPILSYDRPFTGTHAVTPEPLLRLTLPRD